MPISKLDQVGVFDAVAYRGKSPSLKLADATLFFARTALGKREYEIRQKRGALALTPIDLKVTHVVWRILAAVVTLVILPILFLAVLLKACQMDKQKREIQKCFHRVFGALGQHLKGVQADGALGKLLSEIAPNHYIAKSASEQPPKAWASLSAEELAHTRTLVLKLPGANPEYGLARIEPFDVRDRDHPTNEFLDGLLHILNLTVANYNKMGLTRNRIPLREEDALLGRIPPERMGLYYFSGGYCAASMNALFQIKYHPRHLVLQDGRLKVALGARETLAKRGFLILPQVSEMGIDHEALKRKVFEAVTRFLENTRGELPFQLYIPANDGIHTYLFIVEKGKDGKIHISLANSIPLSTAFGEEEALRGIVEALNRFGLPLHEKILQNIPNQKNNCACGTHLHRTVSQLTKAFVERKRFAYEIIEEINAAHQRDPSWYATYKGPIDHRSSEELAHLFTQDQALALGRYALLVVSTQKPDLRKHLQFRVQRHAKLMSPADDPGMRS